MAAANHALTLTYTEPASVWAEALPVGNGRLGAMVRGGYPVELVHLNEDTFWSGPGDSAVPEIAAGLLESVRDHIRAGRHVAAGRELRATQGADAEAFQPVGDLELQFIGSFAGAESYHRSLDLRDGVARVERTAAGHLLRQEVIASVGHQVIAVRLETDAPEGLAVNLRLSTSQRRAEVRSVGDGLALLLAAPRHVVPWPRPDGVTFRNDELRSMRAAALLRVSVEGDAARLGTGDAAEGISEACTPVLAVRGASAVTAFLAIRTGFAGWDTPPSREPEQCLRDATADLSDAVACGWADLRARHITEHRNLMDRVSLHLGKGDGPSGLPALPTDRRLAVRAGGGADEALCVLAFALGRYLLAASSRPGSQAANLQGIWNDRIAPPWNSQYTTNINVEMNYWPAETTALPECHEPLLDLVTDLAVAGRAAARGLYGARGWTCHHNTDLWRIAVPVGKGLGDPKWSQWPMGGAWLSTHLAERWRFGRDLSFLSRTAFPVSVDAARFVLDLLVEDGHGHLVPSPSSSPENDFLTDEGPAGVVAGSTADVTLARELFDFVLEAHRELKAAGVAHTDEDATAVEEVRKAVLRLAPLRAGADGRLLEWPADPEETEPHHRHLSHLIGLYPGRSLAGSPLREAARRSLEGRGDAGTGWSIAWKIGLWARLGDGASAHRLLGTYLRPVHPDQGGDAFAGGGGVYRSMLCAHPPFQIDGNFGVTAAIAEMLVQSHAVNGEGVPVVELLPALPPRWPDGRVTGLRARGAIRIAELIWANGSVVSATLEALAATRVEVRWTDRDGTGHVRRMGLTAGQSAVLG